MKEGQPRPEQKTELEIKAEKFLDLLYKYDFEGENAYFKKEDPYLFTDGEPLFDRSDYRVFKGRKYIWIDTIHLRLGITKDGDLFKPKKYCSFGGFIGKKIDDLLDPESWGKNIYRVHTSARRGIGQYESAVMDYHDLHFRRK